MEGEPDPGTLRYRTKLLGTFLFMLPTEYRLAGRTVDNDSLSMQRSVLSGPRPGQQRATSLAPSKGDLVGKEQQPVEARVAFGRLRCQPSGLQRMGVATVL